MCIKTCYFEMWSLVNGKAEMTGERCLGCGHCEAACPAHAIRISCLHDETLHFKTFTPNRKWLAPGKFDTASLVQLMGSRRSCRNFTQQPVPGTVLEDLIKIGVTAPSGTNSQLWTFTIVPARQAVIAFAEPVGVFFKKVNKLAANGFLRTLLKLFGDNRLEMYYRSHYPSVKKALEEWEQEKKDRLFHGATAALIIGSKPGASCPQDDAMLATQNILLAAHSMGLGTCLIGFAVAAMRKDKNIKRSLGIPEEEIVYSVIALGHPDEQYERVIRRKKPAVRYLNVNSEV